ncbi:MAG: glycosyltransferase family 39 protein [Phycisphaeraceae bacterium]|nr:glycosyltransferase family 39 protein [Phycisphaeraceae bacterium]
MLATTRRLSSRSAVWMTVAAACLTRLLAQGGLSLLVVNDSVDYVLYGQQVAAGSFAGISVYRTPGYPALLGLVNLLFGNSPAGILLVQHLLGVLACGLIAATVARLAGPRMALVAGLLAAVDPWLLGFESCMLTEGPSAASMVIATAIALTAPVAVASRRELIRTLLWSVALGAVLAAGVLIRPSLQVFALFAGLAWILRCWDTMSPRRRRSVVVPAIGMVLAFALLTVPWLAYNRSRSVAGFARGMEVVTWQGFARAGVLSDTFPLDEPTRNAYGTFLASERSDSDTWHFLWAIGAVESPKTLAMLKAWTNASWREHPGAYLKAAARALLWQLNNFPSSGPVATNETSWFLARLGQTPTPVAPPAPNMHIQHDLNMVRQFQQWDDGGLVRRFYRWFGVFSERQIRGIPQIPLFIAACIVTLVSLRSRERRPVAVLMAGTLLFVAAHAAMLLPSSRYGLPAWVTWYIALGVLPATISSLRGDRPREHTKT